MKTITGAEVSFCRLLDRIWALKPSKLYYAVIKAAAQMPPYECNDGLNFGHTQSSAAISASIISDAHLSVHDSTYRLVIPFGDGGQGVQLHFHPAFSRLETLSLRYGSSIQSANATMFKVGDYHYSVEDILNISYHMLDSFYLDVSKAAQAAGFVNYEKEEEVINAVAVNPRMPRIVSAKVLKPSRDFNSLEDYIAMNTPMSATISAAPKGLPKPKAPTFDWDL